jgi:hypothetical protein
MSGVCVGVDRHDGEDAGCEQLLAVHRVRRDLERVAASDVAGLEAPVAVTRAPQIPQLRELIAALDRRVPQVERAGEVSIARDAAALKAKALRRIAELEAEEVATR